MLHLDIVILTKIKFYMGMVTDLIKYSYSSLAKTNKSYICIFSVGLDMLFSRTLKKIFVLRTPSSPSFKCIVQRLDVHGKS